MIYDVDWKEFLVEYLELIEDGKTHAEAMEILKEKYGRDE